MQVEVAFTAALAAEDLLDAADARPPPRCAPRCSTATATASPR